MSEFDFVKSLILYSVLQPEISQVRNPLSTTSNWKLTILNDKRQLWLTALGGYNLALFEVIPSDSEGIILKNGSLSLSFFRLTF